MKTCHIILYGLIYLLERTHSVEGCFSKKILSGCIHNHVTLITFVAGNQFWREVGLGATIEIDVALNLN